MTSAAPSPAPAEHGALPNPSCKIMVFRPTMEEFKEFPRFVAYMESQGAHRAGLAKVIPPKEWKPRSTYDDIDDLVIPAPIQQVVTGQSGLFTQYNIQKKAQSVKEYRRLANSDKHCTPRHVDYDDLERKYWKNLTFVAPIYGADICGSLYDEHVNEWNIAHLNTVLDVVEQESGITIDGVNTPYLYFGMWKTTFAWHTEDMDLYSINYLHFGEPKSWYAIPPEHGKRLERLAKGFFPGSSQGCDAFLRHKMTLISPSILRQYGIPFDRVTQEAGEFMITFPYGYHAGFNHGFNCAESTNFATLRWIEYGKQAALCTCMKDTVKISMDIFVRRFQPERYDIWKEGKDHTSLDHTKPTPEAVEFLTGVPFSLETYVGSYVPSKKKTNSKKRIIRFKSKNKLQVDDYGDVEAAEEKESITESVAPVPGISESFSLEPVDSPGHESKAKSCIKQIKTKAEKKIRSKDGHHRRDRDKKKGKEEALSSADFPEDPLLGELASDKRKVVLQHRRQAKSVVIKKDVLLYQKEFMQFTTGQAKDIWKELETSSESSNALSLGESDPSTMEPTFNRQDLAEMNAYYRKVLASKKRTKSRRQPLSKLPMRFPLSAVKQGSPSDEEMPELHVSEEEPQEGRMWAKPLAHLWQTRPHNFLVEREYNGVAARLSPYCAICTLFHPYYQINLNASSAAYLKQAEAADNFNETMPAPNDRPPSKPLIPEVCFASSGENTDPLPGSSLLSEDGTSPLIACAKCCLQVHSSKLEHYLHSPLPFIILPSYFHLPFSLTLLCIHCSVIVEHGPLWQQTSFANFLSPFFMPLYCI
uniref:[histone H3]-trimethyl-L-lysine(9) demethylase n=1 Tax=Eptatretus burgeri TaxID=7764 RepID=A0A8C4R020_EPTBU